MDGLKIGVGMITGGKRPIPQQLYDNTAGEVFVYHDIEHRGPSYSRNQVLKHFSGYDYLFIFDDDCYPDRHGYEKYFIEQARKHDVHWMGIPNIFDNEIHHIEDEMVWWPGGLGPFQFLTRHALDTLGGYNTAYDFYGWEDIAYEVRARRVGFLGKYNGSPFPLRGLAYIKSLDMYGNKTNQVYTTLEEKKMYAEKNHALFVHECQSPQLYYPYD